MDESSPGRATFSGAPRADDPYLRQADVRVVIGLLNHVLSENYKLRRELEQRRSATVDRPLHETTVARPATLEAPNGEQPGRRAPAPEQPPPRADQARAATPGMQPRHGVSSDRQRRLVQQRPRSVTRVEFECITSQLEDLGKQVRTLRLELRSALWQAPPTGDALRKRAAASPAPRFQPIRPEDREELTFEAAPYPGMWMKLRRPWFYLPLVWATLAGSLVLAAFLLFVR